MQTRFPFRYGIAAMTDLPHLIVRMEAELDGQTALGVAAEGLPPKWFTKHPETSYEQDDLPAMLQSIRQAAERAIAIGDQSNFFDWWWETYTAQMEWASRQAIPPLLAGFGVSLMERAAIDCFCRGHQIPLQTALRSDAIGIDLKRLRPEIACGNVGAWLPTRSLRNVIVRHTVGLGDPLTEAEIGSEDRLEDGLPHSLVENIRHYGLRYFKIKLSGDPDEDCDRMVALQQIFDHELGPSMRFTLDGNEQFENFAAFRATWERFRSVPKLDRMLDHQLLFVEQPLHRNIALDDEVGQSLGSWRDAPPMIIDESDGDLTSFPRAIELGYSGTSHKNCKGIMKSLAALAAIRAAGQDWILSAEDLGNVGPIALLQDLAVVAVLGIQHVERNGHHYFAGLSAFPDAIQQSLVADHRDLYHWHDRGFATLRLRQGSLELGTITEAPFGLRHLPDLSLLPGWNF
jgi:hypothetical protein